MYHKKIHILLRLFIAIIAACLLTTLLPTFVGISAKAHTQSSSCGKWQIISSPNATTQWNELLGVTAISATDVWTVGYAYSSAPNSTQTLTEHWNGTQWSVIASPNAGNTGSELFSVAAVSSNDVWAVGSYIFPGPDYTSTLIEHWNGTTWSIVPSPNPTSQGLNNLFGVTALATNNVWAVGTTFNASTHYSTLVEHWDGTSWSIVSSPNPPGGDGLNSIAAASPNDIWAVASSMFEHWNGTAWSIVPRPHKGMGHNYLFGITVDPGTGKAWAVGMYNIPYHQTLIERWDGSSWNIVNSPNVGKFDNILNGVAEVSPKNVWAVGYYINPKNTDRRTLVEHWDGTNWSVVNSPNAGEQANPHHNFLNAVTAVPGTSYVWATGYYIAPPPYAYTLTEFYC